MKAKLLKNIYTQLICYTLQLVTSVVLAVLLGKLLGPEGLGRYSFVTTVTVMFSFLCDWGLNLFIIREIARKKENLTAYINNSIGLGLAFSSCVFVLIIIILHLMKCPSILREQIYLAAVWVILGVFISFFRAAFHAFEKMEFEALTLVFEKVFLLIAAPFVLIFSKDISLLLVFMIISRVINLFASLGIYKKHFSDIKIEFDRKIWIFLAKSSVPFGLNIFFSNIYLCSDVALLGMLRNETEVGLYRAATAVVLPLGIISLSLNNSLFPAFSRFHLISKDALNSGLSKSLEYLFIIGFFIWVVFLIFPVQIISSLYTKDFLPSVTSLMILSILVPLRFANNTLSVAVTASNLQKKRTFSVAIGAFVNLLLNLLIIPKYSYVGASVTTVIADVIIFAMLLFFVFKYICRISIIKLIYRPLVCGISLWALATFLKGHVSFFAEIIIASFVYFALLYIIGGLPKELRRDFMKIFATPKAR